MKIFLAWPFEMHMIPEKGKISDEVQSTLMQLRDLLVSFGHEVHNAHEREGWGEKLMKPEDCTKIDFDEIASSDLLLVNPGSPASGGTHIEMGWASALGKPIMVLIEKGKKYSSLVQGLHVVSDVTYVEYNDVEELMEKMEKQFS